MKNKKVLIGVGVIAALIVIYAAMNLSGRNITATEADAQFVQVIEKNGCLQCHQANPDPVWYENFPLAKGLIATDRENSYRFIDLKAVVDAVNAGEDVPLPQVAMIEQSVLNNSMPVSQYTAVHWGSGLNANEKQIMLNWTSAKKAYYADWYARQTGDDAPMLENGQFNWALPELEGLGIDQKKADLGLKLYHDTRLSADSTLACATCHVLNQGGADGSAHSRGIKGQFGGVNAPTTYNALFNIREFWDGRAADLQDQAGGPPLNPIEMGYEDFDQIAKKLMEDEDMVAEFKKAYGDSAEINQETITGAIAEFEKQLVTMNSPFDKYINGDTSALTAEEVQGYEIFKKNYCATCHVGPSFGGQSFEKLGTTTPIETYIAERGDGEGDGDAGHAAYTENEEDKYKFKVPNLRNVTDTAPYMHDGSVLTLEQAVKIMFRYQTDNQNPSSADVDKVVQFLKAINGENEYQSYEYNPSNTNY